MTENSMEIRRVTSAVAERLVVTYVIYLNEIMVAAVTGPCAVLAAGAIADAFKNNSQRTISDIQSEYITPFEKI